MLDDMIFRRATRKDIFLRDMLNRPKYEVSYDHFSILSNVKRAVKTLTNDNEDIYYHKDEQRYILWTK